MKEKEDISDNKSLINKKRNRNEEDQEQKLKKRFKRKNRKKSLKNKLEFFLSDINLHHDKYLKNIYEANNSSISPEIFLTFNSIKDLLKDIKKDSDKKNVIIKAIEISHKLIYDKTTNQIRRLRPFQENLINQELYDKCSIYIQNFPETKINHDIIYDLFKEYNIIFIQLLKGKNRQYTGEAFITFKNEEDVENVINKYNNSIPKLISELNPKILKPLKIMTKEDYFKNKIVDNININEDIIPKKFIEKKNNDNIDENILIKINSIKDNLSLNTIKKCIEKIVAPLFIDINKKENSIILRFDSKNSSDLFISKLKEKNYDNMKDILENPIKENQNFLLYELNDKERKEYLSLVKKKIENYKEKKESSNHKKENNKNE